eukprot:CAMPEP_0115832530 /NCGR_PEP_ID=MMETSP0287-20121206/2707_1 /TAXON_ID=412157 /ORGANISM="Chrysochromulina rotalis, Strain UIO044" /LENGTH=66 /DNA_ID=CAMNT_0003285921 /DNA_START=355 /DNA_END=551 /DNA_ORIENTATION=-
MSSQVMAMWPWLRRHGHLAVWPTGPDRPANPVLPGDVCSTIVVMFDLVLAADASDGALFLDLLAGG